MNSLRSRPFRGLATFVGIAAFSGAAWAHVTFRPTQPLRAGGFAEVSMVVPTERSVDTVRVTLEVPDAFLKAGGRLSRVDYPAGWQVKFDKEDKPGDVYSHEMDERSKRLGGADHAAGPAKSPAELKEQQVSDEMRRKWIKRVTFEGGTIPPDGFKVFALSFQLPDSGGEYRFPAVQTYADGVDVSWSELIQGAQHPAPVLMLEQKSSGHQFPNLPLQLAVVALVISVLAFLRSGRKQKA